MSLRGGGVLEIWGAAGWQGQAWPSQAETRWGWGYRPPRNLGFRTQHQHPALRRLAEKKNKQISVGRSEYSPIPGSRAWRREQGLPQYLSGKLHLGTSLVQGHPDLARVKGWCRQEMRPLRYDPYGISLSSHMAPKRTVDLRSQRVTAILGSPFTTILGVPCFSCVKSSLPCSLCLHLLSGWFVSVAQILQQTPKKCVFLKPDFWYLPCLRVSLLYPHICWIRNSKVEILSRHDFEDSVPLASSLQCCFREV